MQTIVGAALSSGSVSPIPAKLLKPNRDISVSIAGFTQDRGQFLLVRMVPLDEDQVHEVHSPVIGLVEDMPDGFVIANSQMELVSANHAFVEMVQAASLDQIRGRPLSEWKS